MEQKIEGGDKHSENTEKLTFLGGISLFLILHVVCLVCIFANILLFYFLADDDLKEGRNMY